MATTVKYKNSNITSLKDGDTKKLNTAGTWVEDDITISESLNLQSKTITPSSSQQTITADTGYEGLSSVTVGAVPEAGAITITEEVLPGGGVAKHITAVDISDTTAQAADVAQGKYFYTAQGVKTAGTASGGGGSTAEKKQVNFIDYDGTILYSYTAEEAQALTALPANPSHSGLVAQGWNWSLANIKSQLTNVGGDVWVGQMYETASGKTEIDINADNPDFLSPYLAIAVNGTVTIDWGDGTATDTVTGTSYTTLTFTPHVYATTGRYTISIDGPMGFYCNSSSFGAVLTNATSSSSRRTYSQYIEKIRCASGIRIGNNAFSGCYALQSITIPDGVTSIGNSAFYYCYALQSITIPDGVTSIGNSVFYYCYVLQSITIPDGVTSIGSPFFYCYALQSITIPEGVTSIGSGMFNSCYVLQSITIPDGVTSIGNNAFSNCYVLKSITIPDGVTSIENNAFSNCYALQSVIIPDGVTSIGNNAFYGCYSFQSITIPEGVTSIGTQAFYNCYSIMEYHLLPTTPPTLAGTNAFSNIVAGTIIYVPQGSLEAYQTATNWSTYASYMQEEPS